MAVIKEWGLSRYMLHWFIINLVCWLGWLSGVAFGLTPVSENISGFAPLPPLGIVWLGNLAVFFVSIVRGRVESEIGAIDVLSGWQDEPLQADPLIVDNLQIRTTCQSPNWRQEVERCSVIMLSNEFFDDSMKLLMHHMSKVYDVQSIFLQCVNGAVREEDLRTAGACNCRTVNCGCLVFINVGEITTILARRMSGTVKTIRGGSRCLLRSFKCFSNRCHHQDADNEDVLIVGRRGLDSHAAVCEILDSLSVLSIRDSACICIPVHPASNDDWTKHLIKILRRPRATSTALALQKYMDQDGKCSAIEEYSNFRFFYLPRLGEIIVNLGLTFGFKVDGFSSALLVRRALQDYIVDNRVSHIYPHVLLNRAIVKSNATNTSVCQALFFRRTLRTSRNFHKAILFVNLLCTVGWMVLVALEGSHTKWYNTGSEPPSKSRVICIIVSIFVALILDCNDLRLYLRFGGFHSGSKVLPILPIIVGEIVLIVFGIVKVSGKFKFGRWIYSVLQGLVWIKWIGGWYIFKHYLPREGIPPWSESGGFYMYSSAFLLNAVLAGVRAKWEYNKE